MSNYRGAGLLSGSASVTSAKGVRFRDARGRWIRGIGGASIFDQIGPRLDIGPMVAKDAVRSVLDFYQEQVEEWMRENAPWEDTDTPHSYAGQARDGLRAEVVEDGMELGLVVYHTVDYGIWLEIRWNGRYAILLPTIEEWGPHLMHEMEVFQ